jgi:hypothetical protein
MLEVLDWDIDEATSGEREKGSGVGGGDSKTQSGCVLWLPQRDWRARCRTLQMVGT